MSRSSADVEEFCARVREAAEPAYDWQRTGQGFELAVDVPEPSRYVRKRHTYQVVLRPAANTFTITDVVRTQQRGPAGQWSSTVERGRARYRTFSSAVDGSGRQSFRSADGHRLIRGFAEELGWQEEARPRSGWGGSSGTSAAASRPRR
ncbi:hypothetical protein H9Y04_27150 [Streptomyces sp. TRM66268-LWL]|uniref:Uncharacterized protein n=1 Tax=Streptomyces polyasparticus TaxID=2767826 RepID=A0ABR7SL67_9ACTN|nr:hypothetical protein [Streptomyces polyasparticus]MBC9716221.1 hypothetical protein [Streptomyces polyasparticus]